MFGSLSFMKCLIQEKKVAQNICGCLIPIYLHLRKQISLLNRLILIMIILPKFPEIITSAAIINNISRLLHK